MTKVIAKHGDEHSTEPEILEVLNPIEPRSEHVTSLVTKLPSATGVWLLFPKLLPIRSMEAFECHRLASRASKLSYDLIHGMVFFHDHGIAHMDVKPDNLVYDDALDCLKIIDFSLVIQVEDENEEHIEYCGTAGWAAPEVGKDGAVTRYRPILADRWLCGRMIHFLSMHDAPYDRYVGFR